MVLDELQENYPDFSFEVMTVFERRQDNGDGRDTKPNPFRVRIYTDNDGVIVRVPKNG